MDTQELNFKMQYIQRYQNCERKKGKQWFTLLFC